MSQSLIENNSLVNICLHNHSIHSRNQSLSTRLAKPILLKDFLIILIITGLKGLKFFLVSFEAFSFGHDLLQHHSNCHSGWEGIRVNDNIRADSLFWKRHLLLRPQGTHYSLLSMSTWELVSYYRISIDFLFHYEVLFFCFLFLRAEINSLYLALLSIFVVFLLDWLCGFVIVLKVLLALL